MTQMAAGLGLLPSTVIDQHFDQRNRYGRLLMIVAQSPQLLGLGVDEDTAAIVQDDVLRVVGRGAVTILDPQQHHHQRLRGQALRAHARQRRGAARAAPGRPLRPHQPDAAALRARVDPLEAAEIEEAGHDLRQMARDIAAGDASPSVLRRRLRRTARPASRPDRTETTHDRAAHARPHHPRDPGLPRRQRLVLRTRDPPRRRPRLAGEVPDQHHPRLHRQPARDAARAARALLLPRQARRLRRAAARGHLAGPRRRAHRAGPPAGRRPRHPPRQDPPGQGPARPLQRHLRVRRRAGRPRPPRASPYGWSTTSSRPTRSSTGTRSSRRSSCAPSGRRSAPRPRRSSTRRSRGTSPGSGSTSTRWSSSARASTPSGSAPR